MRKVVDSYNDLSEREQNVLSASEIEDLRRYDVEDLPASEDDADEEE